jgi:hypothetical protein
MRVFASTRASSPSPPSPAGARTTPLQTHSLIFANRRLENDGTASDQNLVHESTVHLVLEQRGCGCGCGDNGVGDEGGEGGGGGDNVEGGDSSA